MEFKRNKSGIQAEFKQNSRRTESKGKLVELKRKLVELKRKLVELKRKLVELKRKLVELRAKTEKFYPDKIIKIVQGLWDKNTFN